MRPLLLVLLCVACTSGLKSTEKYPFSTSFLSERMEMFWKFNESSITFEVHGKTTGWIGIGLSPNGAMTGADIYIGWVKQGRAAITDRYGIENGFPPRDQQQDLTLLDGTEEDGWTILKFKRKLKTSDDAQDQEITSDTQRIIFALGERDPSGSDVTGEEYHGANRGAQSAYLLNQVENNLLVGEELQFFDIKNDNFEIPARRTYYNCKFVKLPKFKEKHHVVKMEGIIQAGHENLVHHMLIYRCDSTFVEPPNWDEDFRCRTRLSVAPCNTIIAAYGVGGNDFYFPKHAGLAIGSGNSQEYVIIETHYDNFDSQKGIRDSSGFRFTYTKKLRKFDAGIFVLGADFTRHGIYIPPKAKSFKNVGHCTETCMKKQFKGVEKVSVFAEFLHTHLAGNKVKLRHFRNGSEIDYLAKDDSYDFNYQQFRSMQKDVDVLSDDRLLLECFYNTENRDKMTVAGEATTEEMCFAFLWYYPDRRTGSCQSSPVPITIYKHFNISSYWWSGVYFQEPVVTSPMKDRGRTVNDIMNQVDWNEKSIRDFSLTMDMKQHIQYCYGANFFDLDAYLITAPDGQ